MLGIGGIVGAGIFALVGTAAAGDGTRPGAGPALVVSFLLTAVACGFAALCYAEFASLAQVSGSAYSYAYATLGRTGGLDHRLGPDPGIRRGQRGGGRILVGLLSASCSAVLHRINWSFPSWLATDFRTALDEPEILAAAPHVFGVPIVFNLPAVFIVTALTALLVIGVKESSWFNTMMVGIKLVVLAFFVIVGMFYVKPENWHPFMPNGWAGSRPARPWSSLPSSASTPSPRRPRNAAIPGAICPSASSARWPFARSSTCWWPSCSPACIPWPSSTRPSRFRWPCARSTRTGRPASWPSDRSWPTRPCCWSFSWASRGFSMPCRATGCCPRSWRGRIRGSARRTWQRFSPGLFVAVGSALASLDEMADLCNIGTLSAFVIVCAGVLVLRWRDPHRSSGFRTPLVPWVPLLGIASCLWLMLGLPTIAWVRFMVWLIVGLVFYVSYGYWRQRCGKRRT